MASTLETINRLNNEKTAALEKAAAALKADTEATLEHNKASRADAMAVAELTRETYSFESAMGVAETSVRAVNAALRRQEQQARETSAAFREYQALVTRTLEGRRGLRQAQEFLENTPVASGRAPTARALTGIGPITDPTQPQTVTIQVGSEQFEGAVYQGSQEYAQVNGL